jgi:Vitamin K-dependent gamma-carboxylase
MDEPRIAGLVPWLPWPLNRWRIFTELIRAERLAALRIALAIVMLADIALTYGPHVNDFYGPDSLARVGDRELFVYLLRSSERPSWYWSLFRGFGHPSNLVVFLAGWTVLSGWIICRLVDRDDADPAETIVSWNWLAGGWMLTAALASFGIWQRIESMPREVEIEWRALLRVCVGAAVILMASVFLLLKGLYRRDEPGLRILLAMAWILSVGLLGVAGWQALHESEWIQAVPLIGESAAPLDLDWLLQPWDGNATALRVCVYVLAAAVFLLLIGCWTHFSALVAWTLFTSFDNLNHYLTDTGEVIRYLLLLYVMIGSTGAAWSVDAWRTRTADRRPGYVSPWPVRLMFLQLVIIYFATGVFKISGEAWFEGTSLYRVLACVSLTRFDFASLHLPYWSLQLGTWVVLIWEVTFPFMVLFRWTRIIALLLGAIFHIGIWVTFEIGFFAPYMLCFYVPMLPWEKMFFAAREPSPP